MPFSSPQRRLYTFPFPRHAALRSFSTSKPFLAEPAKPISPHVSIYKSFGRPFLKVFLGAVFTYQLVYWAWLRMEVNEIQREKEGEIRDLEGKARGLAAAGRERPVES